LIVDWRSLTAIETFCSLLVYQLVYLKQKESGKSSRNLAQAKPGPERESKAGAGGNAVEQRLLLN